METLLIVVLVIAAFGGIGWGGYSGRIGRGPSIGIGGVLFLLILLALFWH